MRLEREGQKGTSGGPGRAGAELGAAVDVGAVASMPDALHGDVRGNNGGGGGVGNLKAPVPKATSIRSRYRFLSRSPDDMTIKEIPALLKDYQQLVVRNLVVLFIAVSVGYFTCSSTTVPPYHHTTRPPPYQSMTQHPHQPTSIFANSCSQSASPSLQRRVRRRRSKAQSTGVAKRPWPAQPSRVPSNWQQPSTRSGTSVFNSLSNFAARHGEHAPQSPDPRAARI